MDINLIKTLNALATNNFAEYLHQYATIEDQDSITVDEDRLVNIVIKQHLHLFQISIDQLNGQILLVAFDVDNNYRLSRVVDTNTQVPSIKGTITFNALHVACVNLVVDVLAYCNK